MTRHRLTRERDTTGPIETTPLIGDERRRSGIAVTFRMIFRRRRSIKILKIKIPRA